MASPINYEAINAALARPGYLPDGTTAAFLEQSRDRATVIAILFITVLVYVIVALRCYARVFVLKHFGLDDWLALLCLVCESTMSFPRNFTDSILATLYNVRRLSHRAHPYGIGTSLYLHPIHP